MHLNYLNAALIALVPLVLAMLWYGPHRSREQEAGSPIGLAKNGPLWRWPLMYVLSFALVYGYMNLVIHQMGFYELFFTDIMKGDPSAKEITADFLGKYGDKHRHLGHGIFHGVINGFVFLVPYFGFHALFTGMAWRTLMRHLSYWFVTTIVVCGLISEFV